MESDTKIILWKMIVEITINPGTSFVESEKGHLQNCSEKDSEENV